MTTSTDARTQRTIEIEEAMESRNVGKLFRLARTVKKEGSDEFAEILMDCAKKFDRDNINKN